MAKQTILDKVGHIRTILADIEMESDDRELLETLLREIEEQARA